MSVDSLAPELTVRAPVFADAAAVYALDEICAATEYGTPDVRLADLQAHWRLPGTDLARDCWLVATPDGSVVGYARLWFFARIRFYSYLLVHPDYRDKGVGERLLALVEGRARELAAETPGAGRMVILNEANEPNIWAARLLEAHGFHAIRGHLRMEIALDEPPAEPEIPPGLTLRPMVLGQENRAVWAANNEGFADHWNFVPIPFETWAHWTVESPDFDPTLCFLMMDGDEIAGMAQCELAGAHGDVGYVNDLSVRKPWRRRGVALALLRHAFAEFYRRGLPIVALGVDAESTTGAPQLYARAGMRPIRRKLVYEKVLREDPAE
ncbi:MAG TPA: GNAT family N-acetyltransferase [Ktedonobacterales bacterium]|nr:GNAT family N-acetyltransferase [Ktedonobacterales bacterium]